MTEFLRKAKNSLIGRKYYSELSKTDYKLVIVDKPYFKLFLVALYTIAGTFSVFAYRRLNIFENWPYVLALIVVFSFPLYLHFWPKELHRYTILNNHGWLVSPGLTVVEYSGMIFWRNVRLIEKSLFGTTAGRTGFIVVARYYTIYLSNGRHIVINRVFTPEFEDRLESILKKKKIPFTNLGVTN